MVSSLPLIYIYLCDLPLAWCSLFVLNMPLNTNQPKWKRKRNTEIGESLGLSHSLKCSLNGLDMSSVRMMPVEWNAVWPWRLTEQDGDRGIFRRHGGTVKDMKSLGWNKQNRKVKKPPANLGFLGESSHKMVCYIVITINQFRLSMNKIPVFWKLC